MQNLYLSLLLAVLLFPSCQGNSKKAGLTRMVNEWQGKEIVFPENMAFTRFVTDTVDYSAFTLDTVDNPTMRAEYKILLYVDSTGCTGCKLKLPLWKEFMAQTDSISGGQVPFLFFFHPKDVDDIHYLFLAEGFGHPVCIDTKDELNRLNNFPPDDIFHTFLLDKNNKVAVIGNPVLNPKVGELYQRQIKQTMTGYVE